MAGVVLGDIYLRLAWQAWHLETSAGVELVARGVVLGRRWSLAGVALGDIHLRSAWQVWHLETSTCVWSGRRGTCPFHVAAVALGDIYLRFTWQAWHLETSTCVWRGRRGTWRHLPAFGVSGVALVALGGALGRRWSPLVAVGRPGRRATLRGRCGTW